MRPVFSSRESQAYVLSRKFIHMGSMMSIISMRCVETAVLEST